MKAMKFYVKSGALRLSDPCYDNDTWCIVKVPDVRNGDWIGSVVREDEGRLWGTRNMALLAVHEDVSPIDPHSLAWARFMGASTENPKGEVGVDSGQAGIYDEASYAVGPGVSPGEYGDLSTFYGRACAATDSKSGAGVVDGFGVVSSSGYGDGGYDTYVYRVNHQVVGVMIDFGLLAEEDDPCPNCGCSECSCEEEEAS